MLDKILKQLQWRMAVKSYDKTKPLSKDYVDVLVETARLAPTSYGLQPIKLYVVSNDMVKQKLYEAGYKQVQFATASHIFVLTVREKLEQIDIDEQIKRTAEQQNVSVESLSGYKKALENLIGGMKAEQAFNWASKQAYILLGMMISTAAQVGFDVSPMEGFDKGKFDEILGCNKDGYKSVVVLAAGYRDKTDSYGKKPKVRKTKQEFVEYI